MPPTPFYFRVFFVLRVVLRDSRPILQAMFALQCLREERLPVYESSFFFSGFHFCAAVSDFRSAAGWARCARKASGVAFGEQAARRWTDLVVDPSSYSEAGTLSRMTLAAPDAPVWRTLGL